MKSKTFLRTLWVWMLFLFVGTAYADGENVAKIGTTEYATFQAALNAVQDGDVMYLLADADASGVAFTPCNNKNVTIAGKTGNETLNMGSGHKGGIQNSNITFFNMKMQIRHTTVSGTWYTEGMYHATKIKYEKVVFDGAVCTYNDVDFLNCTFTNNPQNAEYVVWNYGGTQIFKGCTFQTTSAGTKSFLKLYNQGAPASIAVVDCVFNDPNPLPSGWKGCDIYNSNPSSLTQNAKIYTANNTTTGTLLSHSSGSEGKLTVYNSPEEMGITLPTPTEVAPAYDLAISTKDELIAFEQAVNAGNTYAGKLVVLENDIDLSGVNWKPIGNVTSYPGITFAGTFDGQNHTISNMTTTDNLANHASAGFFGSSKGTIKNLTLTNVNITSTHYAGGICGYTSNELKIENCKVIGGTITSTPELINGKYDNGDKVGGILGYGVAAAEISGCAVENITVSAYRDLGGIVGCTAGKVDNCSATNCTIIQDNKNGYKSDPITTYAAIVGRNTGSAENIINNAETKVVVMSKPKPITINIPVVNTVPEGDKSDESKVNAAINAVGEAIVIENNDASTEEKVAALETLATVVESLSGNTAALEEITEEGGKTSVEAAVEGSENKNSILDAMKNVEGLDEDTKAALDAAKNAEVHTFIVITMTNTTVNTTVAEGGQATATVKQISFDVTPKATIVANGQAVTAAIPNAAITKVIKFRLPVPASVTQSHLKVTHTHEGSTTDLGLHEVMTSEGGKFIEVESENFSTFSYIIPILVDNRTIGAGKFGTVCHDHNVTIASGVQGATIFSISHKTSEAIVLTEVEETMEAGKPYIYLSDEDATSVTFSPDEGGTVAATAGNDNGLYGVFTEKTFTGDDLGTTAGTKKYVIKDNQIATVESDHSITVKANRAYIVLGEVSDTPTGSAGARTLNIGIEGSQDVTAIEDVNAATIGSVDEVLTIDGKEAMDTQGKVLILRRANGKSSMVITK